MQTDFNSRPFAEARTKFGQPYLELIELIFYGLRTGKRVKDIVVTCRKKGLRKRNGKVIDSAYVEATARYYNLREASSVAEAMSMPRKRSDTKTRPNHASDSGAVSNMDLTHRLLKMVLASDLPSALKIERMEEVDAGLWSAPILAYGELVEDQMKVTSQSLTRGDSTVSLMLTRDMAQALVMAFDQIKEFAGMK